MIGVKLNQAKTIFFGDAVTRGMDRATAKVLSRFGAYVRMTARRSIRKRRRSSRPGEPPSGHTGLLKRFIFFVYDRTRRSVIIGPAKLNKPGIATEALEHGGKSQAVTRRGRKTVTIEARPYMDPAYEMEKPKLPAMWRDSLTK